MNESSKPSSTRRPFASIPNREFLYRSHAIDRVLQQTERCIERAEGVACLFGGSGLGKSICCQALAGRFESELSVVLLNSARLCTRRALLQNILYELGLPYRNLEEGELRLTLTEFLRSTNRSPSGMLLIIDEAQALPTRLLEEVRLLTNQVQENQPAIRLVLAGTTTLEERLATAPFDSLNQRIVSRAYLEPMTKSDTRAYIRHQLAMVHSREYPAFRDEALDAIHTATGGVPRLINQLCDHVILLAKADGIDAIGTELANDAWSDLQQLPAPWTGDGDESWSGDSTSTVVEFGELDDSVGALGELPSNDPTDIARFDFANSDGSSLGNPDSYSDDGHLIDDNGTHGDDAMVIRLQDEDSHVRSNNAEPLENERPQDESVTPDGTNGDWNSILPLVDAESDAAESSAADDVEPAGETEHRLNSHTDESPESNDSDDVLIEGVFDSDEASAHDNATEIQFLDEPQLTDTVELSLGNQIAQGEQGAIDSSRDESPSSNFSEAGHVDLSGHDAHRSSNEHASSRTVDPFDEVFEEEVLVDNLYATTRQSNRFAFSATMDQAGDPSTDFDAALDALGASTETSEGDDFSFAVQVQKPTAQPLENESAGDAQHAASDARSAGEDVSAPITTQEQVDPDQHELDRDTVTLDQAALPLSPEHGTTEAMKAERQTNSLAQSIEEANHDLASTLDIDLTRYPVIEDELIDGRSDDNLPESTTTGAVDSYIVDSTHRADVADNADVTENADVDPSGTIDETSPATVASDLGSLLDALNPESPDDGTDASPVDQPPVEPANGFAPLSSFHNEFDPTSGVDPNDSNTWANPSSDHLIRSSRETSSEPQQATDATDQSSQPDSPHLPPAQPTTEHSELEPLADSADDGIGDQILREIVSFRDGASFDPADDPVMPEFRPPSGTLEPSDETLDAEIANEGAHAAGPGNPQDDSIESIVNSLPEIVVVDSQPTDEVDEGEKSQQDDARTKPSPDGENSGNAHREDYQSLFDRLRG